MEENHFHTSFVWSDDATFKPTGTINRHNCVYCAIENPNLTEERTVNLPRTSVWCGMSSTKSMPLSSTPVVSNALVLGAGHFEYL
jgi:hypothetical protein